VNLLEADQEGVSFRLTRTENRLLFKVLESYPLVPATHQRLTKSEDRAEDQQLLDHALAARRRENQEQIRALLKDEACLRAEGEGFRLTIRRTQFEWLLQAFNDVRVGAWLAIGSPSGQAEMAAALDEKTAPYFWLLEISGQFQMALLAAMEAGAAGGTA
jgi:hypothetical protein